MKKRAGILMVILLAILTTSCGSSVMVAQYSKKKHKTTSILKQDKGKRYKKMKSVESRYMKKFARIYAKQYPSISDPNIASPFFSSRIN